MPDYNDTHIAANGMEMLIDLTDDDFKNWCIENNFSYICPNTGMQMLNDMTDYYDSLPEIEIFELI